MNQSLQIIEADLTPLGSLKSKLEQWAVWTEGYRPNLSTKTSTCRCTGSHDFESLFQGIERQVMKSIDTAINDLPPAQSAAIHKKYLGINWRFPRENYEEMLKQAHDALLISLPRRNVIL